MKADASQPWMPALYDEADAMAVQAFAAGVASKDQQQRALRWIVEQCAATYDLSFRPDSERASAFAEGKRYVGLQIVKMLKLPANVFKPERPNERASRGNRR